jgi:hypothetical protein
LSVEQALQVRHVCLRKGIALDVVLAQADSIEKEKEDAHIGRL